MQHLSKEEIIKNAEKIFDDFSKTCAAIDVTTFFQHPADNKWNVAEHVQHLIISTNITTLAYTLPTFIVKWIGGTPNRPSRTYDEVVEKYTLKLLQGGRASGRFVPKEIKESKTELLAKWNKATQKFLQALRNKTSEGKLDSYLARHPLLGRITLRELCYFTIYHTEHHLNIINNISHPKFRQA